MTAHWTGGLEAGTVMHACANTFLIVPVLLQGRISDTTDQHGLLLLAPAVVWLSMPVVLRLLARRVRLRTTIS